VFLIYFFGSLFFSDCFKYTHRGVGGYED